MRVYIDKNNYGPIADEVPDRLFLHASTAEEEATLKKLAANYRTTNAGFNHVAIELVPLDKADELAELRQPCVWTYDDVHDKWDTACGEAFQIECDGPAENGMKFCCYCQHPIQEGTEE